MRGGAVPPRVVPPRLHASQQRASRDEPPGSVATIRPIQLWSRCRFENQGGRGLTAVARQEAPPITSPLTSCTWEAGASHTTRTGARRWWRSWRSWRWCGGVGFVGGGGPPTPPPATPSLQPPRRWLSICVPASTAGGGPSPPSCDDERPQGRGSNDGTPPPRPPPSSAISPPNVACCWHAGDHGATDGRLSDRPTPTPLWCARKGGGETGGCSSGRGRRGRDSVCARAGGGGCGVSWAARDASRGVLRGGASLRPVGVAALTGRKAAGTGWRSPSMGGRPPGADSDLAMISDQPLEQVVLSRPCQL